MINYELFEDVFKTLKKHLETNSSYSPIIKSTPTGDIYPLVVVEDIENSSVMVTSCGIDSISLLGIEINIYTKDNTFETKKVSARSIANELRLLIDEVCTDTFTMKRITNTPTPNVDNTIYRITMRYNAKQDDKRSKFY